MRYLTRDQWRIGETIAHEIRRTVTETDNVLFSAMTYNPQPRCISIPGIGG